MGYLSLFLSFAFLPLCGLLCLVIILASFGLSVGVRNLYVNILLRVFEYTTVSLKNASQSNKTTKENDLQLIDHSITLSERGIQMKDGFLSPVKNKFCMSDITVFIKSGIEGIVEDVVTNRFDAEELSTWNLLTRTNSYQYISLKLTLMWGIGWIVRWLILLPMRLAVFSVAIGGLVIGTGLVGLLPGQRLRAIGNRFVCLFSFRLFTRAFSAVITCHDRHNMAKSDGICVANHTSPIDTIILGTDNVYAMVGQKQGGFMGIVQRALHRATSHIWFERSEARDRALVTQRLRDHVQDPTKLPILIFPEGTCINNTSVMMFKKGSFEVGGVIYPVAIKYDPRFANCFWNSSKYGLLSYIFMMMTSWAMVADIWYLPPERKRDDEDAIAFASRIKRRIAERGGLVDLEWDGGLKRDRPKDSLMRQQQKSYSSLISGPSEELADSSRLKVE